MGIDTKIILVPCIITEILMKTRFSVMAALICILRGLPKDARVTSFRFLKSTSQRYRNSKKTLYGLQCTLIGPCHRTNAVLLRDWAAWAVVSQNVLSIESTCDIRRVELSSCTALFAPSTPQLISHSHHTYHQSTTRLASWPPGRHVRLSQTFSMSLHERTWLAVVLVSWHL